jgi:hypothetical protein
MLSVLLIELLTHVLNLVRLVLLMFGQMTLLVL